MASWRELSEELDRWDAGAATFWWRDDDACDATRKLDILLRHAVTIPLALAVIPGLATRGLVERLAEHASVVVLQHGWLHTNHAPPGRNEYPASRALDEVSQELADGRLRLAELFGSQAMPVFAPPWHGFDACFLPLLRRNGLIAISRKGPRPGVFAAEKLGQVNAHVSPIKWSIPPSFEEDEFYIEQIIDHLRGRRLGRYDTAEPTGLLTHHLLQDDKSYEFITRFAKVIAEHPAAVWMDARNIFAPYADSA